MDDIAEENDQNAAYQLLIQEYVDKPTNEQYELFSYLFDEWCKSGRSNLLHHMFEIITTHESAEVRNLVVEKLRETYPDENKSDIIELWITHPVPSLKPVIREFLEKFSFDIPLTAATLVMLDDFQGLKEIDPDFHHLDLYLRNIDPLLGSLLIQRVEKIKSVEYQALLFEDEEEEQQSLIDRIRKREFAYLWENILDYPFPFIVELFRIFNEDEWQPVDKSGLELFDILREQLGTDGWSAIDYSKWVVVSKKVDGKFTPLSKIDVDHGGLQLRFSQDLILRPDRIKNQKFQSRGRFNLTDPDLGLHIYLESVRRSDFDGLLHIPIYSNNGVELAEFAIPTNSEKNFVMDNDGMYFTIQTKYEFYSVDLDALAGFLLPISRHSAVVNEIIPLLLERVDEQQKLAISGLNLLSDLHKGREYSLWDLKDSFSWDDGRLDALSSDQCLCTLAVDVGNTTTKIALVVKGSCDHEIVAWEIPSIIYYYQPDKYIIGEEVFEEGLQYTSQTFANFKHAIGDHLQFLRIQNEQISAYQAYQDFLKQVLKIIQDKLSFQVHSIAMSYPSNAPSGFEAWLQEILADYEFERKELIDEFSASILSTYRLENIRGNVVVIDVGSANINAGISILHPPKTRKRVEESRMREQFEGKPEIVVKQAIDQAGISISKFLHSYFKVEAEFQDSLFELEKAKEILTGENISDITIGGKKIKLESEESYTQLLNSFEETEAFYAFKILLRNVLLIANTRGVSKSDIDTVFLKGKVANWPTYELYLKKIFPEISVSIHPSDFHIAKGVGLLANGQELISNIQNDYMLKVSNNGIIGYETILQRGDKPFGKSKKFEIRSNEYIDKLVLDCWMRSPEFVPKEEVQPIKDSQFQDHLRESRQNFNYERVFRKIISIENDPELRVNVSSRGSLYFELVGKSSRLAATDSSVR